MSALLGELGDIAGSVVGESIAFAAGFAAARALEPLGVGLAQEAWKIDPLRAPDAAGMAAGVAQGKVDAATAAEWAKEHGYSQDAFDAMVAVSSVGPGIAAAFELWRRDVIDEAGFRRAAKRLGLEHEWVDGLVAVKQSVLDAADIARGIHRGLIADPGLLAAEPPTGVGNVPAYPVYDVDALKEAAARGYDRDRLGVLVGLQGNPMGPHEAAEALFRHVLTHDDYLRAIAEGNTRNEWAEAILAQSRQIPTARDFLENALRGYTTLQQALAGAALHGMSEAHATMIYQNQGRPMPVATITKALARGGVFQPEPGELTDPYEASIVEGSIKPGYYDLARAMRYTYPSAMFMRLLAQQGEISEADFAQYGKEQGWPPDLADQIAKAVAGSGASGGDANVKKAQTQLWNAVHRSYVSDLTSDADARAALTAAGVADAAQGQVLTLWGHERRLIRSSLSPSEIRKAVGQPGKDQAWALERLNELGWTTEDATTFLAE